MNDTKVQRRGARITTSEWQRANHALEEQESGYVLGLAQYAESPSTAYAVFICEMKNGHVIEVPTNSVVFIDGRNW